MTSPTPQLAFLPGRAVIEVTGDDRVAYLQGLVSNDVAAAVPGRAVWAALLTPQGKWLADFFILAEPDRLLLDCDAAQAAMLAQRLTRFRLRAKVEARSVPLHVHAAWGGGTAPSDRPPVAAPVIAAPDPRLPEAGWRILSGTELPANADAADWDRHRLALGLPDGARDLEAEKSILLEAGFDELNGVSWTKGCYMGQELTARTKYRGLVKRRLVPVRVDGPLPAPGSPVMLDGREVGTMRSGQDARGNVQGLASLRLDVLTCGPLTCREARLVAAIPGWMHLPEPA